MRGLVWFREDLRIDDNTALSHAAVACDSGLVALFIINPTFWLDHQLAACRVEFILRGLQELSDSLQKLNIPLLLINVATTSETATEIYRLIEVTKVDAVFYNRQYEVNELKLDQTVSDYLTQRNIVCHSYDDQTILPPGIVKTQHGENFKVLTPYRRAWNQIWMQQAGVKIARRPKLQPPLNIKPSAIPTSLPDFHSDVASSLWPAGEKAALKRLKNFIANKLFAYDVQRNFPAIDGTSKLSPYLACGMISPRQCFMDALMANDNELESGNSGALTWLTELIWRDFYKNILITVPRVCMHRAYKLETENIHWRFDQQQLQAWQQGRTGYPIIDAAMRQLNQTGWMHNRLRMITAMFLAKNLFFDWRLGEEYFMRHLIDGDLAANNGGWQWSASTGTDAAPYFRIFNPVTQSERFDPDGEFIRQYCPELASIDNRDIHNPYLRMPLLASQCGYPAPTVNLDTSRKQAIEIFKAIGNK